MCSFICFYFIVLFSSNWNSTNFSYFFYEELDLFWFQPCPSVSVLYYIITTARIRAMMYIFVQNSLFPIIYWQFFFHVYFTRTEMLFCYWRLNYTFFSTAFQVRSDALETWKGLGKKNVERDFLSRFTHQLSHLPSLSIVSLKSAVYV